MAWQPGQEAGNAIVDIISGKVTPSGKLATTFPLSYEDVPSARNFPGKVIESDTTLPSSDSGREELGLIARPAEVVYEEDIYVGYRYYSTMNKPVAYEFGYGLSYTQFAYSNFNLSTTHFNDTITVLVEIMNIGDVMGREVVQLYLHKPDRKLNKPHIELVAFAKTKLLQPGETQRLQFALNARDLASFDAALSAWLAETGEYTIMAGASCMDIKQVQTFELEQDLIVTKVIPSLIPRRSINVFTKE